jgi:AraC family transcriptional regulator
MIKASQTRVTISPAEFARRQSACWGHLAGEIVQITRGQLFDCRFRGPCHLLIVHDRALRQAGETRVDGLPPSALRDVGRKMCFVPAGCRFSDSSVPQLLPRTTYLYLSPAIVPANRESELGEVDLAPRLFFEDPCLWATAAKLAALIETPGTAGRLYAEVLGAVLALELVRLHYGTAPSTPVRGGLSGWQRRLVCEYIDEHLAEEISLAELAALVRLSPHHLCRAFKQSVGLPPHRYQVHRRVERAKELLANPTLSITEIAFATGFGGSSQFATAFRKATGTTPSAFRRALE